MSFRPTVAVCDGAIHKVFWAADPFVYGAGDEVIHHPREVWWLWTPEDWAGMCPAWTMMRLIDEAPSVIGKRAEQRPQEDWTVGVDAVSVTYRQVALTPDELAARLAAARVAKITAINLERDRRYDAGFLFEGHVYQIDIESRTDMLAVEAKLKRGEASPHGGYWRSKANVMVPMDDAKVAVFVGSASDYVGAIKGRSWVLKDTVAVSDDPTGIDHTAGWPGDPD